MAGQQGVGEGVAAIVRQGTKHWIGDARLVTRSRSKPGGSADKIIAVAGESSPAFRIHIVRATAAIIARNNTVLQCSQCRSAIGDNAATVVSAACGIVSNGAAADSGIVATVFNAASPAGGCRIS